MDKESEEYLVAKHIMDSVLLYNERFSLDDGHLKYLTKDNPMKLSLGDYVLDIILVESFKINGIPYGYWCDLPFPRCLREFAQHAIRKALGTEEFPGTRKFSRSFMKILAYIAKFGVLQSFYAFWFYPEPCDAAVSVMAGLLSRYMCFSGGWFGFNNEATELAFDSLDRSEKSFIFNDTTFIDDPSNSIIADELFPHRRKRKNIRKSK